MRSNRSGLDLFYCQTFVVLFIYLFIYSFVHSFIHHRITYYLRTGVVYAMFIRHSHSVSYHSYVSNCSHTGIGRVLEYVRVFMASLHTKFHLQSSMV
jgi:hypothetical protein